MARNRRLAELTVVVWGELPENEESVEFEETIDRAEAVIDQVEDLIITATSAFSLEIDVPDDMLIRVQR